MKLVFVHAAGSSGEEWALQRLAFAAEQEVETPDLPGHGRSDAEPLRTVEAMAEWVRNGYPISQAVLVGHSLGASVALVAAARDRPRGLVLIGAAPGSRVSEEDVDQVATDARVAVERLAGSGFASGARASLVEKASAYLARTAPAVLAADFAAARAFDATPYLGRVRAPTLVLVGAEDRLTTVDDARAIARGIAGAELVVIEGAGHMAMLERPRETNVAIAAFLERVA